MIVGEILELWTHAGIGQRIVPEDLPIFHALIPPAYQFHLKGYHNGFKMHFQLSNCLWFSHLYVMIVRPPLMRIVLLWFVLMIIACSASSQMANYDLRFQTLTIDDGLTQNMVRTMLVDKTGFLWIGTSDGLNRFDGTDFIPFRHNPDDPKSLPANQVLSLYEDSGSRIWIGTADGVAIYDPTTELFRRIAEPESDDLSKNPIHSIAEDPYGNMWLGSSKGLFKVVVSNASEFDSEVYELLLIEKFPAYSVTELARTMVVRISSSGHVYMGCNSGLFVAKALETSGAKEEFRQINDSPVSHMAIDRKDRIWYGSARLYIYRPIEGIFLEPLPNEFTQGSAIRAIEVDPKGAIWVSVYNFTEFESASNRLFKFDSETLVPNEINGSDRFFISLAFTRSDLVWGGTAGYGLMRGDLKSANFSVHDLKAELHELRNPKSGESFFIQKGNPHFVRLPTETQPSKTYYDPLSERNMPFSDNQIFPTQSHLPAHISTQFAHKAIRDNRGHYWVFLNGKDGLRELREYDPYMKLIQRKDFNLPLVQIVYFDSKGKLWISLGKEIALFDENNWTFQKHVVLDQPNSTTTVSTILSDRKGIFWLGTDEGLVRYDPTIRNATHYRNINSALNYGVLSLLNDPLVPDDYLWVGTEGGGLIKLQKSTGTTTRYTEKEGLSNLVIYGILPDVLGTLWISTNNGLIRIDTRSMSFSHFTREDGLPTNEFNRFMYGIINNGHLWFESLEGIVAFDPLKVSLDTVAPQMAFTQVKSFNDVLTPATYPDLIDKPIPFAKTITLPWNDNVVTFNYTTLDFRAPGKNQFSTLMEGVDKDWSPPMTERTATYANLAPGKYKFRVLATNSNGIWNEEGIAITLTILAPWWQTGWAYAVYILLLIAVVHALYKVRTNRIRLQYSFNNQRLEAGRLQEVDRLKNEFFSNITHEFRTPITLIINPIQRLLANTEVPEERTELRRIHRSANQLLRLINQLLDLSKIDSGMMHIDHARGEVVRFVREIVDSFAPLANSKQISLQLHCSDPHREVLFDPGALEKITYNLLSNAIKYTDKNGRVDVYLRFEVKDGDSRLYLEVADTGPGIAPFDQKRIFDRYYRSREGSNNAGGGTGIGLALVRELTRIYGGDLRLESTLGEGSKFSVTLPIPETDKGQHLLDGHIERTPVDEFEEDEGDIGADEKHLNDEKPVVLVAEDNDDLRSFLHTCLAEQYAVIEAANGQEAFDLAIAHIPDAVLCDVMMPVMDGLKFLEKVKANQSTSHIPVIMLTAKTNRTDREAGLTKGADAYLTKPFYETELLALLKNLLVLRAQTWNLHRASVIKIQKTGRDNAEDAFIGKLQTYIESHLSDTGIGVDHLCQVAAMSRTQLHRKLKALTGYSTGTLIRRVRIEKARELLEVKDANISEVAFMTGFNTHSYFSKCFADTYGMSPTDYQKQFRTSDGEMAD
ncbi:response regulator [Cryomorpha ignava]|uniref:histidine kinase n=1 Tax=Cryomorpha ignava TaxID=101383 RepID=A0A7K3WS02_9FLAO|nr:hybrid sensor histidine kinase/response regulator transcription factor [Cryomorpha ignava]NEN24298.1 response regulator [Cryomorpha ignava]